MLFNNKIQQQLVEKSVEDRQNQVIIDIELGKIFVNKVK